MKRELVFLVGCIGTRSLLTFISRNTQLLPFVGLIALIISISFIYIYIFGSEKADRQLEWLGDKKIWWNQLRAVHGTLYLLFALFAFNKKEYSWIVLAIDTTIGLLAWLSHTYFKIKFN